MHAHWCLDSRNILSGGYGRPDFWWLPQIPQHWTTRSLDRLLVKLRKFGTADRRRPEETCLFSVCSLRDDNVITSKPTWKLNHTNSILEYSEYFCQISSKLLLVILSYTVSKFRRFLRHRYRLQYAHFSSEIKYISYVGKLGTTIKGLKEDEAACIASKLNNSSMIDWPNSLWSTIRERKQKASQMHGERTARRTLSLVTTSDFQAHSRSLIFVPFDTWFPISLSL